MRGYYAAPRQLGAPKSPGGAGHNVPHYLGVVTFSVVFNLADFAPEPRLGGPDWKMPFNGCEVKVDTEVEGQWDRYPMEVFGRSETLIRYKSWLRVGRVHVSFSFRLCACAGPA